MERHAGILVLAEVVTSQSCRPGAIGADMKTLCIVHQKGGHPTQCSSELRMTAEHHGLSVERRKMWRSIRVLDALIIKEYAVALVSTQAVLRRMQDLLAYTRKVSCFVKMCPEASCIITPRWTAARYPAPAVEANCPNTFSHPAHGSL